MYDELEPDEDAAFDEWHDMTEAEKQEIIAERKRLSELKEEEPDVIELNPKYRWI